MGIRNLYVWLTSKNHQVLRVSSGITLKRKLVHWAFVFKGKFQIQLCVEISESLIACGLQLFLLRHFALTLFASEGLLDEVEETFSTWAVLLKVECEFDILLVHLINYKL